MYKFWRAVEIIAGMVFICLSLKFNKRVKKISTKYEEQINSIKDKNCRVIRKIQGKGEEQHLGISVREVPKEEADQYEKTGAPRLFTRRDLQPPQCNDKQTAMIVKIEPIYNPDEERIDDNKIILNQTM